MLKATATATLWVFDNSASPKRLHSLQLAKEKKKKKKKKKKKNILPVIWIFMTTSAGIDRNDASSQGRPFP